MTDEISHLPFRNDPRKMEKYFEARRKKPKFRCTCTTFDAPSMDCPRCGSMELHDPTTIVLVDRTGLPLVTAPNPLQTENVSSGGILLPGNATGNATEDT